MRRLWLAVAFLALAGPVSGREAPPGERGRWVFGTAGLAVQMEETMEEHGSVRWMTEARYQYIVLRLSAAEGRVVDLEKQLAARDEVIPALKHAVKVTFQLSESRLGDLTRCETDLDYCERTLTKLPKRKKLWLAVGFVAGALVVYEAKSLL